MTQTVLDVRVIPPYERHPRIFFAFDQLAVGESFTLVNDHDPVPLRQQFSTYRPNAFDWEYLEQGPALWRVKIAKTAEARETASGSCCGGSCGG